MKLVLHFLSASLVALGALLLASVSFQEWWLVGVVADPSTIEEYRFGTESMVGHGGAKYSSAVRYSYTQLTCGIVSLLAVVAAVFAACVRSPRWLMGSVAAPIAALLGTAL